MSPLLRPLALVLGLTGCTLAADSVALPDLRRELLDRSARDQAIRNEVIASGAERPDPALAERMRRIDEENTRRMQEIVQEHGWPGPELVGRDGTHAAWLLVQHSNHEFQKQMLPLVKSAYEAGKLPGSTYALLQDRVLVHEGKPQIYGSQGRWDNGVLGLQPIEDEANVDARRAQVGLGPLADYLRGLRETYRSKPPGGSGNASAAAPRQTRFPSAYARFTDATRRADEAVAAFESATGADQAQRRAAASSALQMLAWMRSAVGDHAGARAAFRQSGQLGTSRPPTPPDLKKVDEILAAHEAVDALPAIVEAARGRQIVILNEAHHVSRHRAFALQLARALRQAGFEYLACEAFSSDLDAARLQQRGYPTSLDGFYLADPLFADFVREALRLGFKPVAYEHRRKGPSGKTGADAINEREAGQAANLMEQIFQRDPKARVFIYVGFAHLLKKERPSDASGRGSRWMAGRLWELSGIEPLTIDQVQLTDPEPGTLASALLERVFGPGGRAESVVLRRRAEAGYHVMGSYANDTDLQVLHVPETLVQGRPTWLAMGGYRTEHAVPAELLASTGPRLIQAFAEGETDSPVALDQFVVSPQPETRPVFLLPPGKYRFAFEE